MSSDYGRVHRGFWKHPKTRNLDNSALGLWVKANSWCRDKATSGYINRDDVLTLGTGDETRALIAAGLWLEVCDDDGNVVGIRFNDYSAWNDELDPTKTSEAIVKDAMPTGYPLYVRKQLAHQAANMLREGIPADDIKAGIRLWLTKHGLGPNLLPSIVADVIREREHKQTLKNTLRECRKTGQISPLRQFGYVFTIPDLPDDTTPETGRAFMDRAKRDWIEQLYKEHVE